MEILVDLPSTDYKCALGLGLVCLEKCRVGEARRYLERCVAVCSSRLDQTASFYPLRASLVVAFLALRRPAEALETLNEIHVGFRAKLEIHYTLLDLEMLHRIAKPIEGLDEATRELKEALDS